MTLEVSTSDLQSALREAALRRQGLRSQTSAYRLANGEGDGLSGLTVDVYDRFCTLNLYDADLLPRAGELAEILLGLGFAGVYQKTRVRADLRKQQADSLAPPKPIAGKPAPQELVVHEHEMKLGVHLADGLSTGLFVDQRDNHGAARDWARGGRVLNLFCYTCAFSVSAALGGASSTNVDLSGKALDRGRRNFELNGLDASSQRFFKEDAMKYLERAVRRGDRYDLIILDPPTFSTVKKRTFSVKEEYGRAAEACFRLLEAGGVLLAVTNHTKTTQQALRNMLANQAEMAGRQLKQLKVMPSGLDCPPASDGPWPSKSVVSEVA